MSPAVSARSAIACLLALAAAACDRQSPVPRQAEGSGVAAGPAAAPAPVAAPLAVAPALGLDRSHAGEAAPAIVFKDARGVPVGLASFRGRPVLVNLWATWCAPCVAELPTLERAAAQVRVVAISQDMQDGDAVPHFLEAHGAPGLVPYRDDAMAFSLGYGASLPMTLLFDPRGREVWRWHGGNDWGAAPAKALIAEAR